MQKQLTGVRAKSCSDAVHKWNQTLTGKLSAAFSTLIFIHILYTQGNPTVYHYSLELHISCISGPLHLNVI